MEWIAVCTSGCGEVPESRAANGPWTEAAARAHKRLHDGHRVVVGFEVPQPVMESTPA